jgi:hypothetical protein
MGHVTKTNVEYLKQALIVVIIHVRSVFSNKARGIFIQVRSSFSQQYNGIDDSLTARPKLGWGLRVAFASVFGIR